MESLHNTPQGNTTYTGALLNDQRHGFGTLSRGEFILYEGYWKEGLRHGEGKEFDNEKVCFEGMWNQDVKWTGHGTVVEGSTRFEGEMRDGKRFKGQLFEDNALVYDGEWGCDREKHGQGKLYRNGVVVFAGEFQNGQYWQGQGQHFNIHGNRTYIGSWSAGKYHGEGKQFVDGVLVYVGEFANGQRHGNGKVYDASGRLVFQGVLVQGRVWDGSGCEFQNHTIVYQGEYKGGLYHGMGTKLYPPFSRYEGQFANGNRNGNGKQYFGDSLIYDGEWANDRKNGNGRAFRREQLCFDGEWYNNTYWNGQGTLYIGNLKRIQGQWKRGALTGLCEEHCQTTGRLTFTGNYKHGERDGQGCEYDPVTQDKTFEGTWSNGKRWEGKSVARRGEVIVEQTWIHGKCVKTMETENGVIIFDGEHRDGQRYHGVEYRDGKKAFEGSFKDGVRHGEGKIFSVLGEVEYEGLFNLGYRYIGDWITETANGFGDIFEGNTLVYSGNFKDGKRHGMGTEFSKDGSQYDGEWRGDKRTGQGTEITACGEIYQGSWTDNLRDGKGTLIAQDGSLQVGYWRQGRKIQDETMLQAHSDECPVCVCSFTEVGKTSICGDLRHAVCEECDTKLHACPICRSRKPVRSLYD